MNKPYLTTRVISDTHLEFFNNPNKVDRLFARIFISETQQIDVLFLAGDICSFNEKYVGNLYRFFELIIQHIQPSEIYYVPGNHEYYEIDWNDNKYLAEVFKTLVDLSTDSTEIFVAGKGPSPVDYKNVFMSTLWYPDTPDIWLLQNNMNDFSQIKNVNPGTFTELNQLTIKHLSSYTRETRPDYWVFHYLPSSFSINPQYRNDRLNCYYLSDITYLILELQPKMIVHGHSHTPVEYWFGNTLVKSNPLGYPK